MMNLVVCHPFEAKPPTAEGILLEETFATRKASGGPGSPAPHRVVRAGPRGSRGYSSRGARTSGSGVLVGSLCVLEVKDSGGGWVRREV